MSDKKLVIPCEVYSRVVGYLRPVKYWNEGKVQEFKERVVYDVGKEEEDDSKQQPGRSRASQADSGTKEPIPTHLRS